MFERLFGTASEDLRLTVTEALASQRKVIADQQARIEALIGERNDMAKALSERATDLDELRAMLNSVMAQGSGPKAVPDRAEVIPARKPSFAQSSIASGHMRRADPPGKPA